MCYYCCCCCCQVRIHDACASDLYLRTRSHPIIEHSSGLRFAPFPIEQLAGQQQGPGSSQYSSQQEQQQQPGQGQERQEVVACTNSSSSKQQQGNNLPLQQQQQQQRPDLAQQLADMLADAQLSQCSGLWQAVQDFGWVKASQSPHWALLPEQQRQQPQPLPGQ
jgi:hypothetical protein